MQPDTKKKSPLAHWGELIGMKEHYTIILNRITRFINQICEAEGDHHVKQLLRTRG
ncbi:hypothetical protein AB1K18_01690 [Peribacillus simplex]|uniref:hypothetical protein n=1 Tax=Peribacillus simplex TaxID=1478 RepID=UPI003B8E4168